MTGNRDGAGFILVMKLAMAAFHPDLPPTVVLDQPDDFFDFHDSQVSHDLKAPCEYSRRAFAVATRQKHLKSEALHWLSISRNGQSMNPVLKRELVVRWRGGAVWLMLAVVVLLALVVGFSYSDQAGKSANGDALSQMSRIGRELFQILAFVQVLGWVLLAPSLTATAISGERERGLLDALRLSRLSAANIVWGKFGGALFFVLQIAFGVLPLIAICFLMGGVAPAEFALAAWLQIVTAIFGLSLGLYFSAINRRSSGAIIATLVFALAWFFISFFAAILADTTSRSTTYWATPIYKPLWLIGLTNAFFVAITSLQRSAGTPTSPFSFAPDWATSSALLLAISALFLWGAIRAVRRCQEREREPRVLVAPKKSRRWFARHRNEAAPREYSQARREVRAHWHLLPPSWTRNLNPLLRRELHARLRIPLPQGVWRFWALLGIAAVFGCFALVYWNLRLKNIELRDVWIFTSVLGTIVLALIATVIGALSLSRERENGTWEMLRLSLLSPGEVLRAKFFSIVAACAVYSVAAWPLLLLGAWPTLAMWWNGSSFDAWTGSRVLWPAQLGWSLLVAAVTMVFCAAWGLLVSWRFSKVATAVAWAVGGVFALFGVSPLLGILVNSGARLENWLNPWHPLTILSDLFAYNWPSQRQKSLENFLAFCLLWLCATTIMLAVLYRALRRDLRPAQKESGASTRDDVALDVAAD